ncbi:MAG: T9SS type A sorting domain-containing protein, partial [Bacteroidia bacterium]|nr:T9SS type A sorting domain-containing protein [Bacteroidia bacterium]
TTGFATNQGVARVINGGKISNAENGIKNYTTYSNGNIDWNSRGGVIVANGGIFENNIRDVEFISYHNALGNDYSSFTNCQFLTTQSSLPHPFAHVTLWDVRGVQFKGCLFEYTPASAYNPRLGTGILSMDATYYIDKNGSTKTIFKGLKRGVYVTNANPTKLVSIKNSSFQENWYDGAFFRNMNYFTFEKNELMPLVTTLSNGLYLHSCQNYKVKLNDFHEKSYNLFGSIANGLYAYNSQGGAHEIYKNKFYDLGIGVNVMDKNSSNSQSFDDGLKINCNDFSPSANGFDVALTKTTGLNPPTVMREQGKTNTIKPELVVRNIYGASCNNQENQWYVDPSSGWKIIDHGSNTQSNTQPLPQPSCSGYLVYVVNTNISLNYNEHCKDYPESSGGVFSDMAEAYDNLNTYLADRISANNNNDQYFEIQATLASKMGFLLNDTTADSGDSVVAVLQNYGDYIADSDLQLVFAHMRNGNYGEAQAAINNLDSTRTDWATLLDFMLDMEHDSMKYYRLFVDTNAVNFLEGYANEEGRDGQFVAQNILHFILGMEFEEPRTYLEPVGGERRRGETSKNKNDITRESSTVLFPNPGSNNFQIASDLKIDGSLIVTDILGRKVVSKVIIDSDKIQFSLEGYGNGIYLVEIRDKQTNLIFKEKLIKQN